MKLKDFDVILEKHTHELELEVRRIEYIPPEIREYFVKCLIALKCQVMIDTIDFQIKELEFESLDLIKKFEN